MKKTASFSIKNFNEFRNKMLNWVKPFNIFCLLDNREYNFTEPAFECLLAAGSKDRIEMNAANAFGFFKEIC
ncbi:MAG: hypothetical protein WDM71_12115 [Ferruginibacter sp.]